MAKSTKPLLEFYSQVLAGVNIHEVSDGHLSLKIPSEEGVVEKPCLSNGKRLTLPTNDLLKSGNFDGVLAFHPLSENLLRGESEVIKFLRKMIRFHLASVSAQLLSELMMIAADTSMHEELSPRQAEYLTIVPNANDKCVKVISKLLNKHFDDILNIYLKRSGTYCGDEYRRVAAMSFPILDELNSEGSKIFEIETGSQKNKKTIAALFNHIFPNAADADEWSAGSNHNVAPYLHSLLMCFSNMANHLNKIVTKYRKFLDYPNVLKTNVEWVDSLNHLDKWKGLILPLPGNEGSISKGGEETPKAPTAVKPNFVSNIASVASQTSNEAPEQPVVAEATPVVAPQPIPTPSKLSVPVHAPEPESSGNGISWSSMVADRRPPPPVQPMYGNQGYSSQPRQDNSHMHFQPTPQYPPQNTMYNQNYGYNNRQQAPAPGGLYNPAL